MSFLDLDSKNTKGSSSSSPFLLNPVTTTTTTPTPAQRHDQDAADEEALLAEFHKNPEAAMRLAESYISAARAPRQAMTEITPVAGFVLQTTTTKESSKVPIGTKTIVFPKDTQVFVNICSSSQLPKPTVATEAEIQKAINAEEGATYQVPFQLSPPREYKDTGTRSYLVVDACVHTDAYKRTEKDFDYKLYIMELAMEWVEEKCQIELSRNFQLPSIKSKDELKKRSVILPKPPAIQEVDDHTLEKKDAPKKAIITAVSSKPVASSTKREQDKDTRIVVPVAGKDDIALMSRLLPCPKGTLGIIVEVDLPNHQNINDVTLDVVLPDKLVVHSTSQGQGIDQGKEYHCEVDLLNEPVDLDTIHAEFNRATRKLRVFTIKKKRSLA
ncbi:PIH1 domain-containing protein 1 [Mortierella antarctica]|nr:PIH1 domain-containing protein 1 [Mortierella antarctica]